MHELIQTLVTGVVTGCLYALIALGYSMVYGVLKLLNFAHGDLYMVGAFIGYFAIQWFGGATALVIPVWLLVIFMIVVSGLGVGALGVAIERFAYRPLRNAPRIAPLITALGVSFILEDSVLLLFGGFTRNYNAPAFLPFSESIHIDGVPIDSVQIIVIVVSVVMMFGLRELVNRTLFGKSIARSR
jgi:branched-chain amino acid transport system permease protein